MPISESSDSITLRPALPAESGPFSLRALSFCYDRVMVDVDEFKPKVVLGVAAHPDDLEWGMAGSAAKWAAEGAKVYYLICSDGSKGSANRHLSSSDLIELRRKEQRAAAKVLGLADVFFLDHEDGLVEANAALKRDIVRYLRQLRPDTVITMDPSMLYEIEFGYINHPDHKAVGEAALAAVFPLARDHLSLPELLAEGLEPHNTDTVLLINFTARDKNNCVIDITEYIDAKLKAFKLHDSQGLATPEMADQIKLIGQMTGQAAGYDYAEAFIRINVTP